MSKMFIVGYGSLMSLEGLHRSLPGKEFTSRATLKGWCRSFAHTGISHRYGTLVPDETAEAKYVTLIKVDDNEFEVLKNREIGYRIVDVTAQIDPLPPGEDVVALVFVALTPEEKPIRRSYLNTMFMDLTAEEAKKIADEIDFCGAEIDEIG
ncbi:gamma-glutamylcyclotransferase [Patescibacteria group bacterium]|nr:gamma-glutamylcyclotransferase [Patescibacteria group bacterium]